MDLIPFSFNESPVAEAGQDMIVNMCDSLVLDASSCTDNDGSVVSWEWFLKHESDPALDKTFTGASPTITDLASGRYTVTLKVTDNEGAIGQDSIELFVESAWGDVNSDCRLGLEEAVNILQGLSGQ